MATKHLRLYMSKYEWWVYKLKDKRTNNDLQNTTQETKDWPTQNPQKPGMKSGASEGWSFPAPQDVPKFKIVLRLYWLIWCFSYWQVWFFWYLCGDVFGDSTNLTSSLVCIFLADSSFWTKLLFTSEKWGMSYLMLEDWTF
jgi:hypothetical protein